MIRQISRLGPLFVFLASPALAQNEAQLHSLVIDGDRVYGFFATRRSGEIEKEFFRTCPPDEAWLERASLRPEPEPEKSLSDCPDLTAPDKRGLDDFGGPDQTVLDIRSRGALNCGVTLNTPGFTVDEQTGELGGFDVAVCRAVASAVLGDADAVEFIPISSKTRFTALMSGELDLLARSTTWSFSGAAAQGFQGAGVSFYDGQGFMVPQELGIQSVTELDGARVCIQTGTTTELNLANFFRSNNISYEPVPIETQADAETQYLAGACDVITGRSSDLAALRAEFGAEDNVVLPEVFNSQPFGPVTRGRDDNLNQIVRATMTAMIEAEALGVSSSNVDTIADDQTFRAFIAETDTRGAQLGLAPGWAPAMIGMVGNYGEVYENSLGEATALGLSRGLNAQWTDGGLLSSPPLR